MAAKPPRNRRGKAPPASDPRPDLTEADLLSLDAMVARPLEYPAAHADACAKLACELIRRVLLRASADGESTAMH